MTTDTRYEWLLVALVYTWTAALIIGVVKRVTAAATVLGMVGCMDDVPPCEIPRYESCAYYMSLMTSVDNGAEAPSITPADFGVRIIVAPDFHPLMGSSYPVPGGELVWNVWTFHWYDGDYMGAIGRIDDSLQCRWFEPR
jgi:hypothetical protein